MAKASSAEAGSTDMPVARLIDMSATPHTDTIVAIATAPGRGGVGVVRVSGPAATIIGERIAGALPAPRVAALRNFRAASGTTIDSGLVLHFRSEEHTSELQSLMRISYAVFCLKKKKKGHVEHTETITGARS